jgi:hypothetical protein
MPRWCGQQAGCSDFVHRLVPRNFFRNGFKKAKKKHRSELLCLENRAFEQVVATLALGRS